jgi:hypothetical protein
VLPIDALRSQILELDQTEAATCHVLRPKLRQLARTYSEELNRRQQPAACPVPGESQRQILELSLM